MHTKTLSQYIYIYVIFRMQVILPSAANPHCNEPHAHMLEKIRTQRCIFAKLRFRGPRQLQPTFFKLRKFACSNTYIYHMRWGDLKTSSHTHELISGTSQRTNVGTETALRIGMSCTCKNRVAFLRVAVARQAVRRSHDVLTRQTTTFWLRREDTITQNVSVSLEQKHEFESISYNATYFDMYIWHTISDGAVF